MMRYALFTSLGSLACLVALGGCMTTVDDLGSVSEDLSLVECSADLECDRDEVCLLSGDGERSVGFCSTGDRCTDSISCPEGSVCRGGDSLHCLVVERDEERPDACPRGSVAGMVLCAPGFDNVVVSREPHCETCEPSVESSDRCREAGLTPERCRALMGGGDEPSPIARRCAEADLSREACEELVSEEHDGDPTMERCRAAGFSHEDCRELVTGEEEESRRDRCADEGVDSERCGALMDEEPTRREEPRTEEPRTEEPRTEEPRTEEPRTEEPRTEEPRTEEPREEPSGEEPSGEEPSGEEPSGEEPSGEEPSGEEPSGEEPSGEEPSGEEPRGEEPSGEEPRGEEPAAGEEPASEEPAREGSDAGTD